MRMQALGVTNVRAPVSVSARLLQVLQSLMASFALITNTSTRSRVLAILAEYMPLDDAAGSIALQTAAISLTL